MMVTDVIRLMLFPALMAFAASSDLLTMTISNRVSIILMAGFSALALGSGMGASDILLHLAATCAVLLVALGLFTIAWIGPVTAKLAASSVLWLGSAHLLPYAI